MMHQEINKALDVLQEGKTLLYPTDTVWGIGCDATLEDAVYQVFNIKKRSNIKSLIILVSGLDMLLTIVPEIPESVLSLLENLTEPATVIYDNPQGLAKNVIAKDHTVAIRIVNNEFCKILIDAFGKPIVSTSANSSGCPTPKSFKEIDPSILASVDYIVNLQHEEICDKSSTILKIAKNGEIVTLRQ